MPWFKVDDNLAFHAKAVAAGNPAMGLWVRAGSWAAQQLTDGFVPDHMLAALGTTQQAKRLVENRLWDRVEGGYSFHEWVERQPSKDDVEAERLAARERMKAHRARKKQGKQGASSQVSDERSPEQTENFGRSSGEVRELFGNPDPTRPDPTLVTDVTSGGRGKRATQPPDDFKPSDKHRELAHELGIDLDREWQQFTDDAIAKGKTFKDWHAALRTWLRNAEKWGRGGRPQPTADQPRRYNDVTAVPPPGLSPQEYAEWEAEQRRAQQ